MPSLSKKKRHDDDDEDYKPKKKKRSYDDDEDDEDEAPKKKRRSSDDDDDDDEDDEPKKKKKTKTTGKGWEAVAGKTKESKARKENSDGIREFWLGDGESATVQFITNDPVCLEGHMVKFGDDKNLTWTPCQLATERHCAMCREGAKKIWKAVFKVLDFRGSWDADKKRFKKDEPIEKIWYVGQKLAEQIQAAKDKKGKDLTELVFEVTRSGSGTKTTYNLERAYDEDEEVWIKPMKYKKHKYPDVEDLVVPLTKDELEERDFSVPKDSKK